MSTVLGENNVLLDDNAKTCKRCSKVARSGSKCVNCGTISHSGCVALLKNIKIISENEKLINCCDNTDNLELSFTSEIQVTDNKADPKIESVYLKYIIKQKDVIINQQKDYINTLKSQIDLLNKINESVRHQQVKVASKQKDVVSNNINKTNKTEIQQQMEETSKQLNVASKHTTSASGKSTVLYSDVVVASTSKQCNDSLNSESIITNVKDNFILKNDNFEEIQQINEVGNSNSHNGNQLEEEWTTVSHRGNTRPKRQIKDNVNLIRSKPRKEFITGSATKGKLNTIEKLHFLFVSRFDPEVESSDVLEYLKERKMGNYQVEKLKTKYPNYSSFKVGVPSLLINEVYSPEFWPSGTFISKFIFPKESLNHKVPIEKDLT